MTDVLVCIKRVPDVSGQVLLTEDQQSIDGRYVGFTISEHENCAVELAVRVANATGGTVTVLTVGPVEAADQLRSALALGGHAAVLVEGEPAALGPADIAREIAHVVREKEAGGAAYDLILLGTDAADTGDFQVGIRLAYALERPVVNAVSTVEVAEGNLLAVGEGPDGEESFSLPLPAVATIMEGGAEPRYPTLKGRVAAKKVEIEIRPLSGEPTGANRVRLLLAPPEPSNVEVLGEGPEAATAVVDLFERLGVTR